MLRTAFSRFKKIPVIRSIAVLMTGTAISQLLSLAATPFLARLYTRQDYGTFGTLVTIAGLLAAVAALKFEIAIVTEKKQRISDVLKNLCVLLITMVSTTALILCIPIHFSAETFGIPPAYNKLIFFIPFMLAATAFYSLMTFCLNRNRDYRTVAQAAVWQKSLTLALQLSLPLIGLTYGLAWGFTIGFSLAFIWMLRKGRPATSIKSFAMPRLLATARRHKKYALFTAPQNVLNFISQNLPVYLLGFFFSMPVVGSYFFTIRILQMPVGLVGQSIRQVFLKEASDMVENPRAVMSRLKKMTLLLAATMTPPALILILTAPAIFTFIFGEEWRSAGEYARWMILWVSFLFINPPAITLYNVFGWQKTAMQLDFITLLLRAAALITGGLLLSDLQTIALFSISGVIMNIIVIATVFIKLAKHIRESDHEL